MTTYDTWKTTDPEQERAGRIEEALDQYEDQVWREVLRLAERRYEGYRDELHDQMIDDVSVEDAAQVFLEGFADG
tara:strand:+ start:463 stop:687 length:225 start_codon:yes stop_codon:yes gene_type:complete